MKTKSILAVIMLLIASSLIQAQNGSLNLRGLYPRLLDNGKVVDLNGKQLGSIDKDGKVFDAKGTIIGLISDNGEIAYANGKGIIGVVKKNSFTTAKGLVATIGKDGAVMVGDDFVAFVDAGFVKQWYGGAVYCFFSVAYKEVAGDSVILN
jgi:hypothetical protein